MYKLVIADDEKIIREGLTHRIDWKALGFELVEAFSDGEEIIEYLDSMPVDVVLTDIMMTHINGIDVARYVKESELPCKVVFISGHKEFELALSAIKYGVEDYILKPSKTEEIKTVFHKIRQELDLKARDMEQQNRIKGYWEEMYPIMVDKFIGNLIMGALEDRKDIERRMSLWYPEVDVTLCPCAIADIEIREYETFLKVKWNYSSEQFDAAVNNFIRIFKGNGYFHVIYKQREKIRLFLILNEYGVSEEENELLSKNQINRFAEEFGEIFHIETVVGGYKIFRNIYEVMESQENIIRMSTRQEDAELYLQEQKKLIMTNILSGNIGSAQKIMSHLLKNLGTEDMRYRLNFVVNIFSCISDLLRENNPQLFHMISPFIDYRNILNMTTASELKLYCDKVFNAMKSIEGMGNQFDNNVLVNQVKDYVNKHIYEDMTLENVANEHFITNVYLSRIFKKQTGETFLQYVTRKKMEKAVEMLHNPEYLVYQIGESLGYKTSRYFSKLFYNHVGYYPSQYRKEVLKMGEDGNEDI